MLGHAVVEHSPLTAAFRLGAKIEQGKQLVAIHQRADLGHPGALPPSAAEQKELHALATTYVQKWSFDPHQADAQFSPSPALALYKPDAHIEDLAPNLLKLGSGVLSYTYANTSAYVEPMEALYGLTKSFILHADPKDVRMVKLGSNPDRFLMMTPFTAHMKLKPLGEVGLSGISSLTIERNAHGKLRISDEVLAPLHLGEHLHKSEH